MVGLASAQTAKEARVQQGNKRKDQVLQKFVARAIEVRRDYPDNLCAKAIVKLHRVSCIFMSKPQL